ncbi:hypothetical protein D3C73_792190 [compost metagenome]
MRAAVVARATEVDLQHRVTGVGQQLVLALETTIIEHTDRATVRDHHHRQIVPITAPGQGQETVQRQAIARSQGDWSHAGAVLAIEPAMAAGEKSGVAGGGGVQEIIAGIGRRAHLHQQASVVAGAGEQAHRLPWKRLFKLALDAGGRRLLIEEGRARNSADELDAHRHARTRLVDHSGRVNGIVLQQRAPLSADRVPADHRVRAAGLLHHQVSQAVVGREADRALDAVTVAFVVDQRPAIAPFAVVELVDVVGGGAMREAQFTLIVGGERRALHR